jgi:hypothetical protein
MIWVLYVMVVWVSASVVIVATGWYAAAVLKQLWPEWWQQVVVDMDPYFEANDNSFTARSSGQRHTTRLILK